MLLGLIKAILLQAIVHGNLGFLCREVFLPLPLGLGEALRVKAKLLGLVRYRLIEGFVLIRHRVVGLLHGLRKTLIVQAELLTELTDALIKGTLRLHIGLRKTLAVQAELVSELIIALLAVLILLIYPCIQLVFLESHTAAELLHAVYFRDVILALGLGKLVALQTKLIRKLKLRRLLCPVGKVGGATELLDVKVVTSSRGRSRVLKFLPSKVNIGLCLCPGEGKALPIKAKLLGEPVRVLGKGPI